MDVSIDSAKKRKEKKKSEKHIADFFFLCQYIALLNLF